MEEKRHLQKQLFTDIDSAAAKYNAARSEQRARLKEHLITKAAPEVVALADQHARAAKDQERATKELADLGYSLRSYDDPKGEDSSARA
jgi:hypothetical protein